MLTGKERSYLKKLAQTIQPAAIIGRAGVTDAVKESIDQYLTANELLKVAIQEGAELDAKETANQVADELKADFVQAIGRRFVLYRRAKDPAKRKITERMKAEA
jgi:RNA-binding protein